MMNTVLFETFREVK